jgi:WD40 repeat protein
MRTSRSVLLCSSAFTFILALSGSGAIADAQDPAPATSPTTAYVYLNVENAASTGSQIDGYALHANGAMTALSGSPFTSVDDFFIGVSGNDLFVSNPQNPPDATIETYAIAANGSLSPAVSTPVGTYPTGTSSEGPLELSFDRTGKSIYPGWAENDGYQAYNIRTGGGLAFVDYAEAGSESSSALSFTANNKYAYESGCYQGTPIFDGYTRNSDGGLTNTWAPGSSPLPPDGDNEFCPYGAAAWNNKYVVIAAFPTDFYTADGPSQLFVFNIDSKDGSLTTTNTASTAPNAGVGDYVNAYAFDPSGTWLAVGGSTGVSLFSFRNGVLQQTASYAMTNGAAQLDWDNSGHLIVYSSTYGEPADLYVFNAAGGKLSLAPGSPIGNVPYTGYLGVKAL